MSEELGKCDCGEVLELKDGHPCALCYDVFCTECVKEPFDFCPSCEAGSGA